MRTGHCFVNVHTPNTEKVEVLEQVGMQDIHFASPGRTPLTKLRQMIRVALRHDGTHALLCAAVALLLSYQASQRVARTALRRRAQERLIALAVERGPGSRVQSTGNLEAMAMTEGSSSTLPKSPSSALPKSRSVESLDVLRRAQERLIAGGKQQPALRRRPSERALFTIAESHELCVACLSRCATLESLTSLDCEGEIEEDGSVPQVKPTPTEHAVLLADDEGTGSTLGRHLSKIGTSKPDDDGATRRSDTSSPVVLPQHACPPQCAPERCELCREASYTCQSLVRRLLGASLGAWLGYLLWLRFVASKDTARRHLLAFTRFLGERLFSYKVIGAQHIPPIGPGVICVYHGFVPLDMYFMHEWIHRNVGRLPTTLAADFVFRIPLFGYFARLCGAVPAGRQVALEVLKAGGLVIVAPGGVREAMTTSAEDYAVRWYGKKGFAEVAHAAGAPIVPCFTRHIREVFLVLGGSFKLIQALYKYTKLPFTPFLGPLPVPLTTVVGSPVAYDSRRTPADTADVVRQALAALMRAAASEA